MSKKLIIFLTVLSTLTIGFLAFGYFYMDEAARMAFSAEDTGPLEQLHGWIFAAAAVGGVLVWFRKRTKIWLVYIFLMAMAAMRELDWHKEFTEDSILKLTFYSRSDAPMGEKIGGLIVVILLLASLIYLLVRLYKDRKRIRFSNTPLLLSVLGIGSLAGAKMLDSLARLIPAMKDFVFANAGFFRLMEETFETTGAVFFVACAVAAIYRK